MKYNPLGSTGLRVSELCLGAMTFGEADATSMMHGTCCSEETAHALMNRSLEAGINFIDTADVYGNDGLSERVIGNWFERDGRRDDVVLATKFRFIMGEGANKSGASRYRIVRCVEESLKRLKTDRIDLYQIHMQDGDTPEEETLRALDDLVRQGKVLYIGCSNYVAYRMMESLWISDRRNLERYVANQAMYNLLSRDLEREHIPLGAKFGIGLLPWSPLGAGFLTGKYRRDVAPSKDHRFGIQQGWFKNFDKPRNWDILDVVTEVAKELDATPAQVSIAWLLSKDHVTSVIFGARHMAQLEDNLKATELEISADQLTRLDDVSAPTVGYPYDFIGRITGGW